MGRPTIFDSSVTNEICSRLVELGSIRRACSGDDMPSVATVYNWLEEGARPGAPEEKRKFLEQYAVAQKLSADVEVDGIVEDIIENALIPVLDKGEVVFDGAEPLKTLTIASVNYARLMYDAVKWRAGKKKSKYSDRHSDNEKQSGPGDKPPGLTIKITK